AREARELRALETIVASGAASGLAAWAERKRVQEAAQLLQDVGVCAAPVTRATDLGRHPLLEHSGYWQHLQRQYVGRHCVSASPWLVDGKRPMATQPAPTLGANGGETVNSDGAASSLAG